jgi:hypothetical protein
MVHDSKENDNGRYYYSSSNDVDIFIVKSSEIEQLQIEDTYYGQQYYGQQNTEVIVMSLTDYNTFTTDQLTSLLKKRIYKEPCSEYIRLENNFYNLSNISQKINKLDLMIDEKANTYQKMHKKYLKDLNFNKSLQNTPISSSMSSHSRIAIIKPEDIIRGNITKSAMIEVNKDDCKKALNSFNLQCRYDAHQQRIDLFLIYHPILNLKTCSLKEHIYHLLKKYHNFIIGDKTPGLVNGWGCEKLLSYGFVFYYDSICLEADLNRLNEYYNKLKDILTNLCFYIETIHKLHFKAIFDRENFVRDNLLHGPNKSVLFAYSHKIKRLKDTKLDLN